MANDKNDFVNAVLGRPPSDFSDMLEQAEKLCNALEAGGIKVEGKHCDSLLIAAFAAYQEKLQVELGKRINPIGYIGRARQIANWLSGKAEDWKDEDFGPESLAALENKARHIATTVGKMMYESEGMILLLFHLGKEESPGFLTHLSSVNRREQIKLLEKHLGYLRSIQDEHS